MLVRRTLFIYAMVMMEGVEIIRKEVASHVESMKLDSESTGLQTPSGNQIISEDISGGYTGPVVILGTFSVVLLYLPYQYWKSKREHT